MTLGQRIQAHRTRLGLSQEGLGDKLGVSRQAVSKWEADGAVPDTDKLIALSKLFGITLNELLQVEEPPAAKKDSRIRRKMLLLAVVCFLAGLAVGIVPQAIKRLAPPKLSEQIANHGMSVTSLSGSSETGELFVWVLMEDSAALEDTTVFFLAETDTGERFRQESTDQRASLEGVSYSATLTVPNEPLRIFVGFEKNGREELQILNEYG